MTFNHGEAGLQLDERQCIDNRIRFATVLGHNRTVDLCTENKSKKTTMKEDTDINVENPQWWEKPRQPTDCKIHYERDDYSNGSTRATTSCTPSLRHTRRLQWRQLPLPLSHSLTLPCSNSAHVVYNYFLQKYQQPSHIKCVP